MSSILSYFTHNRTTSDDYTEILLTLQDLEYNSSNHLQWIALYSVLQLGFAIAGDFESYKHVTSNLMLRRVYAGDYESAEMNGLQLARCYNNTGNLVEYKQELEYMLSDKILSEGTHIYQPSYLSELYAHLALGGAYAMSEHTAKAASTHYGKADALKPGPTDYDAYRVEQHEVGFSNNEPIGTDNIQQCIVLIVHDSKNYDTALAHVDRFTDYNSLCTEVIEKIDPRKEKQLNVYLIGGRDINNEITKENIIKVLTALQYSDKLNIVEHAVSKPFLPSSIVFYPKTANIEPAVPGKKDDTVLLRQARINLIPYDSTSKLNLAFDLRKSKVVPVPNFTYDDKKSLLQKMWNNTEYYYRGVTNYRHFMHVVYSPLESITRTIGIEEPELFRSVYNENATKMIQDSSNINADHKDDILTKIEWQLFDSNKDVLTLYQELFYAINNNIWSQNNIASNTLQTIPNQTKSNNLVQDIDLDSIQLSQQDYISFSNAAQQLQANNEQSISVNLGQQYEGTDLSQVLRSAHDIMHNRQQSVVQPLKILPSISTLFKRFGMEHRVINQSNSPQSYYQPLSKRRKNNEQIRD